MKRKKGKSRQWTRRKKRKTEKVDEDDAGEMTKKMDRTKTTTEAGWSSAVTELPLDVWGSDIFSRLPFKQVLLFRCICRAWNALLARIHHHHHPNPTTPATLLYFRQIELEKQIGPSSWFRSYQMRHGNYLTLSELLNGASYASAVTRIVDRYNYLGGAGATGKTDDNLLWPVASCHGLVCFVRKTDRYCCKNIVVGNPLLKEHLLVVRPSKFKMKASQWSEVLGFGFSPGADRYKIVKFTWFEAEQDEDQDQDHFLICTVGDGRGRGNVCNPSWRLLLSFPRYFSKYLCPPGSHLNAGIHWLVSDKDDSVFISRLDLDTEQFGRVEAPQSPDFNATPLVDLSLGVSDGHLIICANLRGQDIIDIWVMNQFNFWTKKLVVRSPIPRNCAERVELLNYGKVEAAAREGVVAEVMLLVGSSRLYACTTRGRHVRQLDCPSNGEAAIVHIPSFLSIKDVAML